MATNLNDRVIAFDPGRTTGTCIVDIHSRNTFDVVLAYAVEWEYRNQAILALLQKYGPFKLIIVEDFKLFPKMAQNRTMMGNHFDAVRMIGIIEACALQVGYNPDNIKFYPPYVKTNFDVKPEHREKLYVSEHNRDAYRLIAYHSLFGYPR